MTQMQDVKIIADAFGGDPYWFACWCGRVGIVVTQDGRVDTDMVRNTLLQLSYTARSKSEASRHKYSARENRIKCCNYLRDTLKNYGIVADKFQLRNRRTTCDIIVPNTRKLRAVILYAMGRKQNPIQVGFSVRPERYVDYEWCFFVAMDMARIFMRRCDELPFKNSKGQKKYNLTFTEGVRDYWLENRIDELLDLNEKFTERGIKLV